LCVCVSMCVILVYFECIFCLSERVNACV